MIVTIFKKELIETLRDKRTLIVMIVIPALLFPLIFKITSSFSRDMSEKAATKTLIVGYVGEEGRVLEELKASDAAEKGKYKWKKIADTTAVKEAIQADSIQLGLYLGEGVEGMIYGNKTAKIKIFHDATNLGYRERFEQKVQQFNEKMTQERLDSLKIDKQLFNVLDVQEVNVASTQEMIGKMAGGMLPYIFIIFGFIGCMYPAIDLFTGEKERGTVETLLTTPVPRWKILTGKMGVVVVSGLIAASFAIGGLYFSAQSITSGKSMEGLSAVLDSLFSPGTLITMFALVIPLVIFFAGIMVPVTVYAKSFKEAQSIITPLNIAVLVPAMIGMFPGIEYSVETAFIPVINVVLATKEIIAGTIDYTLYACTLFSLIVLAFVAVFLSHKHFGKETNISSN
ncbi:MAG: ABC transporter permease [Crocinitomicaceae bacterium]|nr:ABC transporter permease [Crocinitomicaceae bacterium]